MKQLIFIFLLLAATLCCAQTADDLNGTFDDAYDSQDWDRAAAALAGLIELEPQSIRHPYNLACVRSLAGDKSE